MAYFVAPVLEITSPWLPTLNRSEYATNVTRFYSLEWRHHDLKFPRSRWATNFITILRFQSSTSIGHFSLFHFCVQSNVYLVDWSIWQSVDFIHLHIHSPSVEIKKYKIKTSLLFSRFSILGMTDALSLIRDYTINKKEIEVRDGLVYLGDFCWDIKSKTNYMVWGSGRDGQPKGKVHKWILIYIYFKVCL